MPKDYYDFISIPNFLRAWPQPEDPTLALHKRFFDFCVQGKNESSESSMHAERVNSGIKATNGLSTLPIKKKKFPNFIP